MDFVTEIIEKVKTAIAQSKMTKEERAEAKKNLAELERIKELYTNAYKAAEKAVAERTANTNSTKNLENKTNQEYNGDINHSLKWRTDLNKTQFKQLEKWIRQAGNPENTRITDTANWYKGRMDGEDLFAIYSTVYGDNPTILYEVKGKNATLELNILLRALEVIESESSIVEKSRIIDEILKGNWVQEEHDMANNDDRLGERGSNTGYASVLQGKSSEFIGSRAFRNVVKNLFDIQERAEESNGRKSYSLKDSGGNTLTEEQKELFEDSNDAIDLTNNKDLSTRIENQRGAQKYKIIRDYILETLGEEPVVLSDGIVAKADKSDALHLANKSANRKVAYISEIKAIIERAKLYAIDNNVDHKKFDEFRYYQVNVKYGNEIYPVYLNVGRSKNGDGYHIYDITRKIGATVKQKDALERVENDLRSETDSPISSKIISQPSGTVKNDFSLKGGVSNTKLLDTIEGVQKGKHEAVDTLSKYAESGIISTELYGELIEKYGAISKGENPARDIDVPRKTADGKKVSHTVRSILEAKATPGAVWEPFGDVPFLALFIDAK